MVVALPNDRTRWLAWRREGIGGSDAAAVADLSPYGNPYTVYLDKVGLAPLERAERPETRWGKLLEPAIIEAFTEDTGIWVVDRQAQVVHPRFPWMRATLDGRAAPGGELPLAGVVETKATNGRDGQWKDGPPLHVQIQAQHQMACDERTRAYVAVLLAGADFLWWSVERDEAAIATLMEIEEAFWREHVIPRRPPDVDGSTKTAEALRAAFARPEPEEIELPAAATEHVAAYLRALLDERDAKARRTRAGNELMALMGAADIGTVDGKPVVRWPLVKRKGYTVQATEYRKLTVVGGVDDG